MACVVFAVPPGRAARDAAEPSAGLNSCGSDRPIAATKALPSRAARRLRLFLAPTLRARLSFVLAKHWASTGQAKGRVRAREANRLGSHR